ncbi:TonB family protein [candidate division KSB1 bacterium]|nr:TonB family protein [candidate division KSB1 bacterium]
MIATVNTSAGAWLDYFSYAVLQNTIFLTVIFLVLYLLRSANARLKYGVSILGIIKLLIPPFLPGSFGSSPTPLGSALIDTNITLLPAEPAEPKLILASVIFLVWSSILIFRFVSCLFSTIKLRWQVRTASFIKSITMDNFTFKLFKSSDIRVPMSIGIRPRRIFVPDSWSTFPPAQQESLLRHEVAHIQRWDGLFHIFQVIAQSIYFFHPLVWLLSARVNDYREMACDDIAVEQSDITPLTYSRCLVHVAEKMLPTCSYSSASALIKQRNKLYHRVNYQVKESTNMKTYSKRKIRFMWSVLFLLFIPLSWYCKSSESPQEPPPGSGEDEKVSSALVGKIWGQVTHAETGDPLPGANVHVVGTTLGAATDMAGRYYIVNVPPGVYQLECSFIGFASMLIADVKVAVKASSQQDFKLKAAIIHGEKISVTANKPNDLKTESAIYIAYDEPPLPVGGWSAVQKHLVYPEIARKAGVEGVVTVSAHIDAHGNVIETKIEKSLGDNGCDEAAITAIKKAKWTPAKQRGKPVAVWVGIPVEFKLK